MIRTDAKAQHMRHDDTDKADPACDGDRRAGGGSDRDDGDVLDALHLNTKMASGSFSESQRIETACQQGRYGEDDGNDRTCGADLRPGGTGKGAKAPECQVAELAVIGQIDKPAGGSARQSRQCDTCKQHGRHRGPPRLVATR